MNTTLKAQHSLNYITAEIYILKCVFASSTPTRHCVITRNVFCKRQQFCLHSVYKYTGSYACRLPRVDKIGTTCRIYCSH